MNLNPFKRKKGDPLQADTWNRMLDTIGAGIAVKAGAGVAVSQTPDGAVISLADGGTSDWIESRITVAPPPNVAILEEDCKYTAVAIGIPSIKLENHRPRYNRLFESDRAAGINVLIAKPALVGDLCYIARAPDGSGFKEAGLMVLTEKYATKVCAPTPPPTPTGPSAPVPPPSNDPTSPPPPPPPGGPDSTPIGGIASF